MDPNIPKIIAFALDSSAGTTQEAILFNRNTGERKKIITQNRKGVYDLQNLSSFIAGQVIEISTTGQSFGSATVTILNEEFQDAGSITTTLTVAASASSGNCAGVSM